MGGCSACWRCCWPRRLTVYALVDGEEGLGAAFAWGAAFAGILSYAALLRPAVRVDSGALVLRNMLDTNVVPLAAIDEVAVRQVLAVRANEKRYVSPAIGNSFFRTIRPRTDRSGERELTYPDYVRDRILHLADGARRRTGSGEIPPVRRELGLARDRRPGRHRRRLRGRGRWSTRLSERDAGRVRDLATGLVRAWRDLNPRLRSPAPASRRP